MLTPSDVALVLSIACTCFFFVGTLSVPPEKEFPKLHEFTVILCMATAVVTVATWLMWYNMPIQEVL